MSEATTYPAHLLTALDGMMDALPVQDAIDLENTVMDALHEHGRTGKDEELAGALAAYPDLLSALRTGPSQTFAA